MTWPAPQTELSTIPEITVIGSLNVDTTIRVDRFPVPGETRIGHSVSVYAGGKGANQAAAVARLNGSARLLGAVGNDAGGTMLLETARIAGVDTSNVDRVKCPTGTAVILLDDSGENQIVVAQSANDHYAFNPDSMNPNSPVLCQLEVGIEVICAAASHARGFFALNAAPARSLPEELVSRCDLIIVNETEYADLNGLPHAKLVAVSRGEAGAQMFEYGELIAEAPSCPTAVSSTVGAGDAFCAALVSAILHGLSPAESLRVACAVGAHAVSQPESQPALRPMNSYRI